MDTLGAKSLFQPLPASVEKLAKDVVDAGFHVHSALGPGLLESAYESCLALELAARSIPFEQQTVLPIIYRGHRIENGYRVDLIVDDAIVVELKAVDAMASVHSAQLLTYMKLTRKRLGFLMNFNVAVFKQGLKRMIL